MGNQRLDVSSRIKQGTSRKEFEPLKPHSEPPKNIPYSADDNASDALGPSYTSRRMTKEQRALRFARVPCTRYEELKSGRDELQRRYIRERLMADPNKQYRLEDAITLQGACEEMCPEFERYQRAYENDVDLYEKNPATGEVDHSRMLKKFMRAAAGLPNPMPCDVRSPEALNGNPVGVIGFLTPSSARRACSQTRHAFVRDRSRSVRKDFSTSQHCRDLAAVYCHEVVARFHIIAIHELCENFPEQIHEEQRQLRFRGYHVPNEPEFRAYEVLFFLDPSRNLPAVTRIHPSAPQAPAIQRILELFQACTARKVVTPEEVYATAAAFFEAISQLGMGFVRLPSGDEKFIAVMEPHEPWIALDDLAHMLGFDSPDEALDFCKHYSLQLDPVEPSLVQLGTVGQVVVEFKAPTPDWLGQRIPKTTLVENLKGDVPLTKLIFGRSVRPGTFDPPPISSSTLEPSFETHAHSLNIEVCSGQLSHLEASVDIAHTSTPLESASNTTCRPERTSPPPSVGGQVGSAELPFSFKRAVEQLAKAKAAAEALRSEMSVNSPISEGAALPCANVPTVEQPQSPLPFSASRFTPPVRANLEAPAVSVAEYKPVAEAAAELVAPPETMVREASPLYEPDTLDRFLKDSTDPALDKLASTYRRTHLLSKCFERVRERHRSAAESRRPYAAKTLAALKKLKTAKHKPLKLPPDSDCMPYMRNSLPAGKALDEYVCEGIENFRSLQPCCATQLRPPSGLINKETFARWRIPIGVTNSEEPPARWLQKKLALELDDHGAYSAETGALPTPIPTKAILTLAGSAFVEPEPVELDYCTPVLQLEVHDPSVQDFDYWQRQGKTIQDFLSMPNMVNVSAVGIIYWPSSAQDRTSEQDIRQALAPAGLPDLTILIMATRNMGQQLINFLSSLASAADGCFQPVPTWDQVLGRQFTILNRLVDWIIASPYVGNPECCQAFINVFHQTLERCAALLNVPSLDLPIATRLASGDAMVGDLLADIATQFFCGVQACRPAAPISPSVVHAQFSVDVEAAINACLMMAIAMPPIPAPRPRVGRGPAEPEVDPVGAFRLRLNETREWIKAMQ
ncbi:actin cytoskeleton and mitosis protein [Massospora cicadina]|nr:actin cytoskeleton and mitosis protein [Massospora cicadina]